MDSPALTSAPVFSSDSFGTDGSPAAGPPILSGHCVVDGHFARLPVLYLDAHSREHCLSRGFATGAELVGNGSRCAPIEVRQLLQHSKTYDDFNLGLENGPHDAVPRVVRGDFSVFTAPAGRSNCGSRGGRAKREWLKHVTDTCRSRSCVLPAPCAVGSLMEAVAGGGPGAPPVGLQRRSETWIHRGSESG